MGSRVIVIVCRDENTARARFGAEPGRRGIMYTRTGRSFFSEPAVESEILSRLAAAAVEAGLWERLKSGWFCLDAELMPWSAKAQELLRVQYVPVGTAADAGLTAAVESLARCAKRDPGAGELLERFGTRRDHARRYIDAYREYCRPVESIDDYELAPFHLLAAEGRVFTDQDHLWHLETLAELARHDESIFRRTRYRVVELEDAASEDAAAAWWNELVSSGGEGMVVKPLEWIHRGPRGLTQPAIKCRGPEYLRIIYGPEYRSPENLRRLRNRNLGAKRKAARREFTLGLEALHRFVDKDPLYRVHECVFGVLALESEPVDPRL